MPSSSHQLDSPRERHYSRWALAAVALAGLGVADFLVIVSHWFEFSNSMRRLEWRFGLPTGAADLAFLLCVILFGPVCVALGRFALGRVRANARLRGGLLARTVVVLGSIITVGVVSLFAAVAITVWTERS